MNDQDLPRAPGSFDYELAFVVCPYGMVVTDPSQPDNPITHVNTAFIELTGYSASDAIGRNCRFLQGRETDAATVAAIRKSLLNGEPVRAEILNYRKTGETFWTDLSINAGRSDDGRLTYFVGVLRDISSEKDAKARGSASEAQLSSIVQNMPGYVFRRVLKADGSVHFIGPKYGIAKQRRGVPTTGWNPWGDIHPDDVERVRAAVARSMADVAPLTLEFRSRTTDGSVNWYRTSSTPTRLATRDIAWDGIGINITREKTSEDRLANIVENMPGYIFRQVLKRDGTIEFPYLSASFARIVDLPENVETSGVSPWKYIHPADIDIARRAVERSAKDLSHLKQEFRLVAPGGKERWLRTYSSPVVEDDGQVVWDGVGVDVTTEKLIEIRLAYLAHHDPLTGLANREMLMTRLMDAIDGARTGGAQVALSHLILIGFSEVYETLGTSEGDAALKSIARRMSEVALLDEDTVAARIGGAEFAILRQGKKVGAKSDQFVRTLMQSLVQPLLVGEEALTLQPSVGTAFHAVADLADRTTESAAGELMKRATIALSAAVKSGAGTHRVYNEELDHRTRHRMTLRHSLRHAIHDDEFEVHYQPLVDLRDGRIVSAEALIRWQHPEFGLLRPDLFISLAEESGLIGLLGEWVMRNVMLQAKTWIAKGLAPPKIALNISGNQLLLPEFPNTVRAILDETGADASRFELEITEGILIERSPETLSALGALKALGFELVIDDFGAGHASFQYLRDFPVDKLKIDQMFVRQLRIDSSDAMIVQAIAALAHSLKLGLVAEGIETAEQRDFLRDQGCRTGQGYFFSLPLSAEDFAWMIEHQITLPIAQPAASKSKRGGTKRLK